MLFIVDMMRICPRLSEGEVKLLDFMIRTSLRGGSLDVAMRSTEFASLSHKVHLMQAKIREVYERRNQQALTEARQGLISVLRQAPEPAKTTKRKRKRSKPKTADQTT